MVEVSMAIVCTDTALPVRVNEATMFLVPL